MLISWRVYIFFLIFNQSEALDVFVVEGGCLLVCGLRCPLAEWRILLQKRLEGLKHLNTELNIEVKVDLKSETLSSDLPFWHRIPFLRKDVWIFVSEVFVASFVFEVGLWHLLASRSNSFCSWWSTKKALCQEWHVLVVRIKHTGIVDFYLEVWNFSWVLQVWHDADSTPLFFEIWGGTR